MDEKSKSELENRFWGKVLKTNDNDCWNWGAYLRKDGYGSFKINKKVEFAHRVAWIFTNGKICGEMDVLHQCDNRRCVNPNHLYLGTHQQNMKDRDERKRGYNSGEQSSLAKLTSAVVLQIRDLYKRGMSQYRLAKVFGVTKQNISSIVKRETWKLI